MPFPPPRDLPDPEIKPESPSLQANSLPSEPPGKPNTMHWPGIETGTAAWEAAMLTTIPPTQLCKNSQESLNSNLWPRVWMPEQPPWEKCHIIPTLQRRKMSPRRHSKPA